jgi:hypothetical protein
MFKKITTPVAIKGELFWARWMGEINHTFDVPGRENNKYECVIGNISEEDCEKLKSILQIDPKFKESQGHFILAKSIFPHIPVDNKGNPVPLEAIGNGTKVNVELTSYETMMSKKHGFSPSIVAPKGKPSSLVVTEVVTYVAPEESLDDVL